MIREFKLNDKEYEKACEFEKEHRHKDIYKGAIGGHLNIEFTPTSLGDAVTMHCTICGKKENITDYSCW